MVLLCLALVATLAHLIVPVTTPVSGAPGIAPQVWVMDSFTRDGDTPVEVANPERYTAQFLPGGQAVFRLDCNQGQAFYTAADGDLAFTDLATTDAPCPRDAYSDTFAALLVSADRYRFDETGNLILQGPGGAIRLRTVLTGVTWQWQGVADVDGVIFLAPDEPDRYTLLFQADERLTIRADCNRAQARVRTDGSMIAIRTGGATRMACRADSLGALYVFGLEHVEHWYLFNGVLTLVLPDGGGTMIFSPVVRSGAIPAGVD